MPQDVCYSDLKFIIEFVYKGEIDVSQAELQVRNERSVFASLLSLVSLHEKEVLRRRERRYIRFSLSDQSACIPVTLVDPFASMPPLSIILLFSFFLQLLGVGSKF